MTVLKTSDVNPSQLNAALVAALLLSAATLALAPDAPTSADTARAETATKQQPTHLDQATVTDSCIQHAELEARRAKTIDSLGSAD